MKKIINALLVALGIVLATSIFSCKNQANAKKKTTNEMIQDKQPDNPNLDEDEQRGDDWEDE